MSSVSSSSRKSKKSKNTELEKLHKQADSVLHRKAKEIEEFNKLIEELEQELTDTNAKIVLVLKEAKEKEEETEDKVDFRQMEKEIEELNKQNANELEELTKSFDIDMKTTRETYQRSLVEAEKWAQEHAEAVRQDKQTQLDNAKEDLEELRKGVRSTHLKDKLNQSTVLQQTMEASVMNQQRNKYLQDQIREITTVTREEVRDVRQKIDECLLTIDMREKENFREEEKALAELNARQEKYDSHVEAMKAQFATERLMLQQSIESATQKLEQLNKIHKKIEKHHEKQLTATLKDITAMKASLYQAKTREEGYRTMAKNLSFQKQEIDKKRRSKLREIALLDDEITELSTENKELTEELMRLDNKIYGSSQH